MAVATPPCSCPTTTAATPHRPDSPPAPYALRLQVYSERMTHVACYNPTAKTCACQAGPAGMLRLKYVSYRLARSATVPFSAAPARRVRSAELPACLLESWAAWWRQHCGEDRQCCPGQGAHWAPRFAPHPAAACRPAATRAPARMTTRAPPPATTSASFAAARPARGCLKRPAAAASTTPSRSPAIRTSTSSRAPSSGVLAPWRPCAQPAPGGALPMLEDTALRGEPPHTAYLRSNLRLRGAGTLTRTL